MCVSYLTVTSSVNITTRCVMERHVAVTMRDPAAQLIFWHAGSVELVTRSKFGKQHAFANERKQKKWSSDWKQIHEAPAAVENTHIKRKSAGIYRSQVCLSSTINMNSLACILSLILEIIKTDYSKRIMCFSTGWEKFTLAPRNV